MIATRSMLLWDRECASANQQQKILLVVQTSEADARIEFKVSSL